MVTAVPRSRPVIFVAPASASSLTFSLLAVTVPGRGNPLVNAVTGVGVGVLVAFGVGVGVLVGRGVGVGVGVFVGAAVGTAPVVTT